MDCPTAVIITPFAGSAAWPRGSSSHLVPLFALLFGWLFLDELLQVGEIVGGLLVISGVITAMRANSVPNPAS